MIARLRIACLRLIALVIPPCHEVTRLLSQGMDHPLPWATRLRLRLHLAGCVWCRRYARQLRHLRRFIRMFSEEASEPDAIPLSAEARARFKAAVIKESAARQSTADGNTAD